MNKFDQEIAKLIDFVFDICKNKIKCDDTKCAEYTFFGYRLYINISDDGQDYYSVHAYSPGNDWIYFNININYDKSYYIHRYRFEIDGYEGLIRDLLVEKHGIDGYKEKLKSLLCDETDDKTPKKYYAGTCNICDSCTELYNDKDKLCDDFPTDLCVECGELSFDIVMLDEEDIKSMCYEYCEDNIKNHKPEYLMELYRSKVRFKINEGDEIEILSITTHD